MHRRPHPEHVVRRRRRVWPGLVTTVALLTAVLGAGGWHWWSSRSPVLAAAGNSSAAPGAGTAATGAPAAASADGPPAAMAPSPVPPSGMEPPSGSASAGPAAGSPSGAAPPRPAGGQAAQDALAGVLGTVVAQRGSGRLVPVPGAVRAPGRGRAYTVRVEVERGLPVDARRFAAFVLATLNDPRSWGHGGTKTFARTAGRADIRVVLASPATSAKLCRPLLTHGTLSCGMGDRAVLTFYRWVRATPDYRSDRTGYRRYLVNHEVGHVLGHGHEQCPGRGRRAPVMQQQTKGLKGCRANSWPFP